MIDLWNESDNPELHYTLINNSCIKKMFGDDKWRGKKGWPDNIDPPIIIER